MEKLKLVMAKHGTCPGSAKDVIQVRPGVKFSAVEFSAMQRSAKFLLN